MKSQPFTRHQIRILQALRQLNDELPYAPSVREIMENADISSVSIVTYNITALGARGYLTYVPNKARTIRLTERGKTEELPEPTTDNVISRRGRILNARKEIRQR